MGELHSEQQLRDMFDAIKVRAEKPSADRPNHRVKVRLCTRQWSERSRDGYFEPNWNRRGDLAGWLDILRVDARVPGDAMIELMLLAHELGHARSFIARLVDETYRAAVIRYDDNDFDHLTREDRCLILSEERCAWRFARDELAFVQFRDWRSYWRWRGDGLQGYVDRFRANTLYLDDSGNDD